MFTNRQFTQVLLPDSPFSVFRCTHRGCSTWGLSSILVFRQGGSITTAVYFKAINPSTLPIGSFSPLYDTEYSFLDFIFVPARTAVDSGILHYTEIDSLSVFGFLLASLRLLISLRPDTLIFLTRERISVFSDPFYAVPLYWYLLTVKIPPLAFCFQMLLLRLWVQPDKQRKLFREEKVRFPMTSPTTYLFFYSQGNLC